MGFALRQQGFDGGPFVRYPLRLLYGVRNCFILDEVPSTKGSSPFTKGGLLVIPGVAYTYQRLMPHRVWLQMNGTKISLRSLLRTSPK